MVEVTQRRSGSCLHPRATLCGVVLGTGLVASGCKARELDLFEGRPVVATPEPDVETPTPTEPGPNVPAEPSPEGVPAEPEPPDQDAAVPRAEPTSGTQPLPPVPTISPTSPTPGPMDAGNPSLDAAAEAGPEAGTPRPDIILIDDFEDGSTFAMGVDGWWYTTTDSTSGTQTLVAEESSERPGFTLHMAGSDYTDWGMIVGLDLRGDAGYFDATPTNAVRFWVRATTSRPFVLRLLQMDGGSYTTDQMLTTEWQELTVPFSAFRNAADTSPVDASSLGHLQLYFNVDPFEAWVDDVAFVTVP